MTCLLSIQLLRDVIERKNVNKIEMRRFMRFHNLALISRIWKASNNAEH